MSLAVRSAYRAGQLTRAGLNYGPQAYNAVRTIGKAYRSYRSRQSAQTAQRSARSARNNSNRRMSGRRMAPYRRYAKPKPAKYKKRCDLWKKPPRKFVKKVEAVLSRDTPCGMVTRVDGCSITIGSTSINQQSVWNGALNMVFNDFTMNNVLDFASVMFNGKAGGFDQTVQTNNFALTNKIIVENQSAKYTLKNFYAVGVTVTIWTHFPKTTQGYTPLQLWNSSRLAYSQKNYGSNAALLPNTCATLYEKPTQYHEFNTHFKSVSKSVHLGPGQSYKFTRNGPCGVYDYTSSAINPGDSPNLNQPGKNSWITLVLVADPVISTASGMTLEPSHYATSASASTAQYVTVERTTMACIRAPDCTPIANKVQVNLFENWLGYSATPGVPIDMSKPLAATSATI